VDLRHLTTFQAVLREGSFLRASRALGYSQGAITLHIQELERELGIELFQRRGRYTSLTEAGRMLAERSEPVLEGLEAMRRAMTELRDGGGGHVRLGAIEPTASLRVVPVLARFCRERPSLRVTLDVGGTVGVSQRVADGAVDIGLCSAPAEELELRFEPLFEERMGLLVQAGHRLARAKRVKARDLDRERLLLTDQGCAYRSAIQGALASRGAKADCAMEIAGMEALKHAVQQGLGIAVVPAISSTPSLPGTVLRELDDVDISLQVGLVRRRADLPPTRALGSLVSELSEELRNGG
jgi:DNA-binding transcriptional LysR family regulator